MRRFQLIALATLMALGATAILPQDASAYGPEWQSQQKAEKKQWEEKKAWENKGKADHQKWEDKSKWEQKEKLKQEKPAWREEGQWKDKSQWKQAPKEDYGKSKAEYDKTQVDPSCPGWTDGCSRWIGFPEKH